jgi:hypothetical protein
MLWQGSMSSLRLPVTNRDHARVAARLGIPALAAALLAHLSTNAVA